MLLPLALHLCTCALSQGCARSLSLSLDARSFSVGVAALRASFFAFAKHVNFCVYFLIFVRQCALFLFSCCLLLLASLLASVAPVLLCLCCAACSASASATASACCFALHFIHSIKTSKHSRRRMGKRGRKSYGNCFSWHLLSQAIGSLQPFVLTAFSCVGLWKLAQNMPQLGIPRQLCSCCGESFFFSFSFSSFSSFVHFGTSVAFCICSLCMCVCECVFYICLNRVKSCMLIVRLVSQMPQRKGKKLLENVGKCRKNKRLICIFS